LEKRKLSVEIAPRGVQGKRKSSKKRNWGGGGGEPILMGLLAGDQKRESGKEGGSPRQMSNSNNDQNGPIVEKKSANRDKNEKIGFKSNSKVFQGEARKQGKQEKKERRKPF